MNRQNRPDRDSLLLLAAMRFADRSDQLGIKVRNLSPLGMMAECPVRPICGERVLVELRNIGWIDGTVTWVANNRFGVVFDREIDCKVVRRPVTAGDQMPETRMPRLRATVNPPIPVESGRLRRI